MDEQDNLSLLHDLCLASPSLCFLVCPDERTTGQGPRQIPYSSHYLEQWVPRPLVPENFLQSSMKLQVPEGAVGWPELALVLVVFCTVRFGNPCPGHPTQGLSTIVNEVPCLPWLHSALSQASHFRISTDSFPSGTLYLTEHSQRDPASCHLQNFPSTSVSPDVKQSEARKKLSKFQNKTKLLIHL